MKTEQANGTDIDAADIAFAEWKSRPLTERQEIEWEARLEAELAAYRKEGAFQKWVREGNGPSFEEMEEAYNDENDEGTEFWIEGRDIPDDCKEEMRREEFFRECKDKDFRVEWGIEDEPR